MNLSFAVNALLHILSLFLHFSPSLYFLKWHLTPPAHYCFLCHILSLSLSLYLSLFLFLSLILFFSCWWCRGVCVCVWLAGGGGGGDGGLLIRTHTAKSPHLASLHLISSNPLLPPLSLPAQQEAPHTLTHSLSRTHTHACTDTHAYISQTHLQTYLNSMAACKRALAYMNTISAYTDTRASGLLPVPWRQGIG